MSRDMSKKLPKLLDKTSNYLADRKGLLPILGIILVMLNFVIKLILPGWLSDTEFFLHLGIIIAIFGFMLAWAL